MTVLKPANSNADESVLVDVDAIIAEAAAGRMFILVDDEDRENEGDLIIPADCVTPEIINFMATHGRGLICLAMDGDLIDRLELPQMVRRNTDKFGTAFTVSIEAREGVTTGISAADRAHTVKVAISDTAQPDDISTPGHVFPIRAQDGGVLTRTGHTEAAVDIAKLAGFKGAAVICEVMNDDGTMARLPELMEYASKFGMKIGKICELVDYRKDAKHD